jgi:antitoxin VapB
MNQHNRLDEGVLRKRVQIFKNGRSRAIRIPKEFEFAGDSVVMYRQPDGAIVVMTAVTAGLLDHLKTAEPWTGGEFISDESDLRPVDEVDFQ